jgi:hypothetical protein
MPNLEQAKSILNEALMLEKAAEVNCDSILHELRINGFHDVVEHIKNDEVHHQEHVRRLIGFLGE